MAIEGPLRELALTDVIQLLHLSRKTGTLSIGGEGVPRPGLIQFEDGFVVAARPAGETSPLGRLLVMAGKATAGQVEAALALQQRQPRKRIGALLTETQGVSARDVQRQLRFQVEEAVFELVRWRDGYFRFEETEPQESGGIAIRVPAESLLMESMRRADEWSEMASGEPDASLVPVLVERARDAGAVLDLQPREWQVLAAVNGVQTLREIAREIGRGEFDVAKAVFSLASGGIVELRTRPAAHRTEEPSAEALRGGLATIEADLTAGRIEEATRRVDALLAGHPTSAAAMLLRGRTLVAVGRIQDAVSAMEEAVRHDPLLSGAYYHLGLTAARVGDFRRAQENLRTFMRLPDAPREQVEAAARAWALIAELGSILENER